MKQTFICSMKHTHAVLVLLAILMKREQTCLRHNTRQNVC